VILLVILVLPGGLASLPSRIRGAIHRARS
jgi:hypothetical protein